jgi:hypothetical protein
MQKEPHATVATDAKTRAANVVRSLFLDSLFREVFFQRNSYTNLCDLGGLFLRRLGFDSIVAA